MVNIWHQLFYCSNQSSESPQILHQSSQAGFSRYHWLRAPCLTLRRLDELWWISSGEARFSSLKSNQSNFVKGILLHFHPEAWMSVNLFVAHNNKSSVICTFWLVGDCQNLLTLSSHHQNFGPQRQTPTLWVFLYTLSVWSDYSWQVCHDPPWTTLDSCQATTGFLVKQKPPDWANGYRLWLRSIDFSPAFFSHITSSPWGRTWGKADPSQRWPPYC